MTDNGGEQYGSPGDRYEPRQQEQGSWFTPSGDRYFAQSQYQDDYSEGQGEANAAEEAVPEVPPDRAGATGTAFSGFPGASGYSGLNTERPGMAEPYPAALDGLGAPATGPSAYSGTAIGPLPQVNRPYTAPEADRGASTAGTGAGDVSGVTYGPGTGNASADDPFRGSAARFPPAAAAPTDTRQPEHQSWQRTGDTASAPLSAPGGADSTGERPGSAGDTWSTGPKQPAEEHRGTSVYRVPTGEHPVHSVGGPTAAPIGGAEASGGYPGFGSSMRTSETPSPEEPRPTAAPEWVRPVAGAADAPSAPAHEADRPTWASRPENGPGDELPGMSTAGEASGADRAIRHDPVASYDDELSRPYSGRIPMEDPAWSGRASWEDSAQERPSGGSASDSPAARRDELGGDLGTGSGNTWAFSRDDDRLPESVREAAARAQEKRRDGSPDHTTQVFRSEVGVPSAGSTGPSSDGIPAFAESEDPLSAVADQQARARAQEEPEAAESPGSVGTADTSGGPEGWSARPEVGFSGGQGTQAMPVLSDEPGREPRGDELGPDLRGAAQVPRGHDLDTGAAPSGAWTADTGQGTQAMPVVSDELGPDLRSGGPGSEPPDGYGDHGFGARGHSAGEYRPAGMPDHGYGDAPAKRSDDHGAPSTGGYGMAPGMDFGAATGHADSGAQPSAAYGAGATGSQDGYGEPGYADPGHSGWGPAEQGALRYGADVPGQGYPEPGYADRVDQGFPDRGYPEEGPNEYGYGPDHPDSPYTGPYSPESEAAVGDGSRQRRGRSGRDRVAEEFPEFEERPLGGSVGDPYPGYDNIDYWPETAPGATATLWLGIVGLVPLIGLFTAIAALFMGPSARRSIQRSSGELEGLNLVKIGMALAWFGVGLFLVEAVVGLGSILVL
ncbi:MAG: hypothetical protein M0026_02975 [Nocardiopsaceae bacterium]|nr:hypothetical protein [Nocardiopsaceae bacterium]